MPVDQNSLVLTFFTEFFSILTLALFGNYKPNLVKLQKQKLIQILISYYPQSFSIIQSALDPILAFYLFTYF